MTPVSRHEATDQGRQRGADRRWLGTALVLGGVVMLFLGGGGVSGAATIGEQVPYLASGSIPGGALVVAGAVLLARESTQRSARRTEDLIAELHALLVEEVPDSAAAAGAVTAGGTDGLVALAGSERYHCAGCVLVAGKPGVEPVNAEAIDRRQLSACDVCEPDRPAA
jgi:hypothetical protein